MTEAQPTPDNDQQAMADAWAEALAEQSQADESSAGGQEDIDALMSGIAPPEEHPYAKPITAEHLQEEGAPLFEGKPSSSLDVILDIPVTLSMEIGRTKMAIRNLLQLNQGSVVELERLAGEPMDVLVNGTLIAHGEVVVVNEKFGIRLTDVISPAERVKKLK